MPLTFHISNIHKLGTASATCASVPRSSKFRKIDMLIFIIIIRHELGLNRPVSASSNSLFTKVFQVVFVHFVYNAALFWHPVVVHSCYML
jgi:hypothetical protein